MTGKAVAVPMALSCGPSITGFEVVLDRNYPRPFVAKLPLPMHVPYHPSGESEARRAGHGDEDLRHRASARMPVASDGLWRISLVSRSMTTGTPSPA